MAGSESVMKAIDNGIHQAVQELYSSMWAESDYDLQLRSAVSSILGSFGITGVLVCFRNRTVNLYCRPSPAFFLETDFDHGFMRKHAENLAGLAIAELATRGDGRIVEKQVSGLEERFFVFPLSKRRGASGTSLLQHTHSSLNFSLGVLICRLDHVWNQLQCAEFSPDELKILTDYFISRFIRCLLPMILDAFRHRERRLAAFPPRLVEKYWEEAHGSDPQARPMLPPWDPKASQAALFGTATLSLDLRKSTYCMEYARSEREFGQWLDHLVEKIRAVAHLHGGIFDKFTGDGALIHFLYKETLPLYAAKRKRAVDTAVHCAVDLQRAVEIHLRTLRTFLHHDAEVFGAGIAIDVGKAFWSFDHRNNPIVVGKGVVGACRVVDSTPRQCVRLTNLAYMALSESVRKRIPDIRRQVFSTKESSGAFDLECWEFSVRSEINLGQGPARILDLCKRIKEQFDDEKGNQGRQKKEKRAAKD